MTGYRIVVSLLVVYPWDHMSDGVAARCSHPAPQGYLLHIASLEKIKTWSMNVYNFYTIIMSGSHESKNLKVGIIYTGKINEKLKRWITYRIWVTKGWKDGETKWVTGVRREWCFSIYSLCTLKTLLMSYITKKWIIKINQDGSCCCC